MTNQVVDMGLLTQTAEPAARSSASRRSTSSPTGATSRSRTSRPARRPGLTPHVPKPQRGPSVREGFFRKDEFRYDAAERRLCLPGRADADADTASAGLRELTEDRLRQREPAC